MEGFSSMVREPFRVSSMGGSVGFLFVCAIKGLFLGWEHGGRHCWVVCFFTTQAKCIHEGGTNKTVEFRPYINTCPVQVGWGVFIPPTFVT